jgi:hypothetical protein
MVDQALVTEYLAKIDGLITSQLAFIRLLEAQSADTTEAQELLACWSAAYNFFAKRLEAISHTDGRVVRLQPR